MYEQFTREMTENERMILTRWVNAAPSVTLASTLRGILVWSAAFLGCVALIGLTISSDMNALLMAVLVMPFAFGAIISLYVTLTIWETYRTWSRADAYFQEHTLPVLRRALEDGQVNVKKITAQAVVEITAFEDEEPGYIFDLGDNTLFFIKSPGDYPMTTAAAWPNTVFEIVRTRVGDHWIDIFCQGDELRPSRTVEQTECKDEIIFAEHEELVKSDLNSFVNSLLQSAP